MTDNINFNDFQKLDIRIGKIIEAEKAEDTEKLMKMQVDFGEEKRQIVASIAPFYTPEQLIGKECPFLFNLEPKDFRGHESQGMILAADDGENKPLILTTFEGDLNLNAKVR